MTRYQVEIVLLSVFFIYTSSMNAESEILVVSSTTWHEWWVDNMFLKIRLQIRKKKKKSHRCNTRQIRNKKWSDSVYFVMYPSVVLHLAKCRIFVLSFTTWHQRWVANMCVTIDYNQRKWRRKVLDAIHDVLGIWNNATDCINCAIKASNVEYMSCHLVHGTNEGCIIFS